MPSICFGQANSDIYLEGTYDYYALKLDSSYIKVRLSDCEESRLTVEQKARGVKCKSKDEINKWKANKNLFPIILTEKPNFYSNAETLTKKSD